MVCAGRAALSLLVASVLVAAACGSSGKATKPAASSPSSSGGVATTEAAAVVTDGHLPATPITASLDQAYRSHGGTFDAGVFGVAPGAITAAWYRAGDFWAVYYRGLDQAHAVAKCPGNSIKTTAGFEHVSNSPYGHNACPGFTDMILPPGSLHFCANVAIVYVTQIPINASGTLYASLEQGLSDGSIQGVTSQAVADASHAPAIDPRGCPFIS